MSAESSEETEEKDLNTIDGHEVTELRTTLLTLNDHCLEHVCCYLTTIDQYQVTKLHERLACIVATLWKLRLRECAFQQQDFAYFSDDEFLDFMCSISAHIQSLTLNYLERRRFQLLTHCCFERVHTLSCIDPYELSRCQEERYASDAVDVIKKSFPNLQVLNVKGFHILDGRQLFNTKNFKRIQMNFR